jgi:hypothetical protein
MRQRNRAFVGAVVAIITAFAVVTGVSVRAQDSPFIHVASVSDLYLAVNDPANAGARIVIAPGTYFLDPTQVNGGRLEFQQDMTIVGQRGDAGAVVIDASNLPSASYALGGAFATGAVRMGRGSNTLEWLTVQGAVNGTAAVETDLPAGPDATIVRVAHIVAQGNTRGIDVRHLGPAFNGHVLRAILRDNEARRNTQFGIRVINTLDVTDATIHAMLSGNRAYDNIVGCFVVNLGSSQNTILVDSRSDRFTNNSVGVGLLGGYTATTGTEANSNALVFHANGDRIEQNDVPLDPSLLCQNHQVANCYNSGGGIGVTAGWANTTVPNEASANIVRLAVVDTTLFGNQDADINAWGAFSPNDLVAGTDNHVRILLKRNRHHPVIFTVDSDPPDPDGRNTVVLVHGGSH